MMKFSRLKIINRLRTSCAAAKSGGMGFVFKKFIVCAGILTAHNKAYALHSLAVVRATPNRGEKTAATSHKQDVICKKRKNFLIGHPWPHKK